VPPGSASPTRATDRLLAVDLAARFRSLRRPVAEPGSAQNRFSAVPVGDDQRHRLGMDALGSPCLLIATAERTRALRGVPIVLEHLAVLPHVTCRITDPDGRVDSGRFTVVRCTDGDAELHEYFLRVAAVVTAVLGPDPTDREVSTAIEGLVELFRAIEAPSQRTVQGLWAELFLIDSAKDGAAAVRAWHVLPSDRYDLSAGAQRIEVKAAIGRTRRHQFSLDQVIPVAGIRVLLASLLIERSGSGTSLAELADRIRQNVGGDPQLLLHVDRVIGVTLGERWRHAGEERFDTNLAERSLRYYDVVSIPKPSPTVPQGVTDVRFRADLTAVPPGRCDDFRSEGGLFRAVIRE
jgi:hypothetical protein